MAEQCTDTRVWRWNVPWDGDTRDCRAAWTASSENSLSAKTDTAHTAQHTHTHTHTHTLMSITQQQHIAKAGLDLSVSVFIQLRLGLCSLLHCLLLLPHVHWTANVKLINKRRRRRRWWWWWWWWSCWNVCVGTAAIPRRDERTGVSCPCDGGSELFCDEI